MFKKIKNWLGIEGVKVKLDIEDPFDPDDREIRGTVVLTSQTEQYIQALHFQLIEKYTRGRRKGKLIDEYIMGATSMRILRIVQPDVPFSVPFKLQYQREHAPIDQFGKKNILYKGISNAAKWLKNANSEYILVCEAEVEGNALRPYEKKILN